MNLNSEEPKFLIYLTTNPPPKRETREMANSVSQLDLMADRMGLNFGDEEEDNYES